uniref:Uncharacterized protein n=1 Tax=Anguilla anguilla TaxID=7936 RepID=A0A0E9PSV0_ANGAN
MLFVVQCLKLPEWLQHWSSLQSDKCSVWLLRTRDSVTIKSCRFFQHWSG